MYIYVYIDVYIYICDYIYILYNIDSKTSRLTSPR